MISRPCTTAIYLVYLTRQGRVILRSLSCALHSTLRIVYLTTDLFIAKRFCWYKKGCLRASSYEPDNRAGTIRGENFAFCYVHIDALLTKLVRSRWLDIGQALFFCAKQRTRPISSHLDQTSLVKKGFIIWPTDHTKEFRFCGNKAGDPELVRRAYVACSGRQSEHRIHLARSRSQPYNKGNFSPGYC